MSAYTKIDTPTFAGAGLRHVLRLLHAAPAVDAAFLLRAEIDDQFELVDAWPAEAMIGHHLRIDRGLASPALRDAASVALPTAFTLAIGRRPASFAMREIPEAGLWLVVLASGPVADLDGQIEAATAMVTALATEGARSAADIAAHERVSSIVRSLPVPFVFIDAEGATAFINLDARTLLNLAPTETRPQAIAAALSALIVAQRGAAPHHQLAIDHRAATTFYVERGARVYKADTRWVLDGLPGRTWTFHDVTEERRMEDELRELASTDYLTGALNRRAFDLGFRSEIERSRRHGIPLSLIMIDLDHFKRVNDVHGHQAGDMVLKTISDRIGDTLRDSDIFGRLGGEEFAVLLPHTELDRAAEVAERLAGLIRAEPVRIGHEALPVTASIGLTSYRRGNDDMVKMTKRADEALYAAKQTGRDRVVSTN